MRPLCYVSEELTAAYAEHKGFPVIPCGCSQRAGAVRRTLRDFLAELKKDQPHVLETMLAAMGKVDTARLMDPRFLDLDADTIERGEPDLLPVLAPTGAG